MSKNRTLFVRADGNSEIGMGHLMRCLTIADACRELHMEVCFLLADDACMDMVRERGFQSRILDTDYRQMDSELPQLSPILSGEENALLLVDSYQVTGRYLQTLSDILPVIYMDDLGERLWPVRAIVNYNHYATHLSYETWYRNGRTKLLLGSIYAPLRPIFAGAGADYEVRRQVKNILILTGGSDSLRIAEKLAESLKSDEITLQVVCGPFSQSLDRLQELEREWGTERLQVRSNVSDMASLMAACDLAVSAAGSTLYELCAVGVPTICFTFADNQLAGAREFDQIGIIPYAGDFRDGVEEVLAQIAEQVNCFERDERLRRAASGRMRELIDGRGAQRIAMFIQDGLLRYR